MQGLKRGMTKASRQNTNNMDRMQSSNMNEIAIHMDNILRPAPDQERPRPNLYNVIKNLREDQVSLV